MSTLQIQFLGACGNQTADRETVSFVVRSGESGLLIDTGPGVVRQIYRSGLKCTDVSDVLVTHCHGDHTAGFTYFVWSIFYESLGGATPPTTLSVHGLQEVLDGLKASLEFAYDPDRFPFEIDYLPVPNEEKGSFSVRGIEVATVPVAHAVPTVGARFDVGGTVVSYSADTLYCEDFVELARDSRLMIHEGFVTKEMGELSQKTRHATAQEAGRAAAAAGAAELALVHFFPPFEGKLDHLIEEARGEFDGPVVVPEDLQAFEY